MVNAVGGPSNIMVRGEAAKAIVSDPSYRLLSDLKFCLQVLELGHYVNIDEPGVLYRRHPNSDFVTNCLDKATSLNICDSLPNSTGGIHSIVSWHYFVLAVTEGES